MYLWMEVIFLHMPMPSSLCLAGLYGMSPQYLWIDVQGEKMWQMRL